MAIRPKPSFAQVTPTHLRTDCLRFTRLIDGDCCCLTFDICERWGSLSSRAIVHSRYLDLEPIMYLSQS
jgi:hypothetical protein